jgi:alpha-beta hydrolase superfamily lysophospholipase
MTTHRKRLLRLGIGFSLVAAILYLWLVWWCAKEIAEPSRRSADVSHLPYFDGTAQAGFVVEKFVSSDGMPCLVCTPEHVDQFSKRAGIIREQLTAQGIALKPAGEIVGTLLILHGRSGIKEDYLPVAERFCAVGFRCIIPDLPGHGVNPEPFTTYGVLEAPMILKCYTEAAVKFGFTGQPCAIFGQSMGGAEAIHTAALSGSPFAAMVVVSSFDKLETVIRGQANSLLGSTLGAALSTPAGKLFEWRTGIHISDIDSSEKARRVRIPTLVVHGDADKMVPTASGKALFDSFPLNEKQWLQVPGAQHNNVLVTDYPLYATMARWFLQNGF